MLVRVLLLFFLTILPPKIECTPKIFMLPPPGYFKPSNTNFSVDLEPFHRSLKSNPCTPPPKRNPPPKSNPPPKRSPPPKSPPPPKRSPPPKSPSSSPNPSDPNVWLKLHNEERASLGINPLVWDENLAYGALTWATTLASRGCVLEHGGIPGTGQNLAWWSGGDYTGEDAVKMWINEKKYYTYGPYPNYCQPKKKCGHYTQVIWKDTEKVGCARVRCRDGGLVFDCDYFPPGNYYGEAPF